MAGHSHWSGIKRKKELTDQKRGALFSKLATAITAAAAFEPDPHFNPRLRSAIEKAREAQMPADNIERALSHATENNTQLQELIFEAYGPGGSALIIEITTDNRNRTVQQIKTILADHGGKWAEVGSVRWGFEPPTSTHPYWQAKFPLILTETLFQNLCDLTEILYEHVDVQEVYTNALLHS
ncbi:MAG: hypothetical protein RIQ54_528 [Candidatus Parcubacteria bacterium]|jgi:YebC/PmpR family DNA-binding regulatory protein